MEKKINTIISDVLGVSFSEINLHSSPTTIDNWDSLTQMNIIVTIEQEFNIEFTDQEILDIKDVASIYVIVHSKLENNNKA